MEGNPIDRGRGRLRKTIGKTIKRDLDFNVLGIRNKVSSNISVIS